MWRKVAATRAALELGNKDGLQRSYGIQASILQDWGRLEEAFELLKKKEALCLELGNRSSLAYCYWYWGILSRAQLDRKTEREKLASARDIFSELNMPRERDEVRAELEKTTGADRATLKLRKSEAVSHKPSAQPPGVRGPPRFAGGKEIDDEATKDDRKRQTDCSVD